MLGPRTTIKRQVILFIILKKRESAVGCGLPLAGRQLIQTYKRVKRARKVPD
jgi:hypothetical protein